MKDFLIQRNNSNFSTYISDQNPSNITTNGALTIIDNTDIDHHIEGLVHNSYNIFLDNLFLASGYGFSSYGDFSKAAYLVNTYNSSYKYLLDKIEDFKNLAFNLEYNTDGTENQFDRQYNKYGCLMTYKYIEISQSDENINKYIIKLNQYNCAYIDNIEFKIDDNELNPENNIVEIGNNVFCSYIFHKNSSRNISEFKETSPQIYINNELIQDFDSEEEGNQYDTTTDASNIIWRYILSSDKYDDTNILLECKRDNNLIYSYNYESFIKWRYKILPFNTNNLKIYSSFSVGEIFEFDKYNFGDSEFNLINDIDISILNKLADFIDQGFNNDESIFLDDSIDVKFVGDGYNVNDELIYMYDYIALRDNINLNNIEFYLNNILDNGWKFINFQANGNNYTLLQSSQRYLGKHTWNIRYKK